MSAASSSSSGKKPRKPRMYASKAEARAAAIARLARAREARAENRDVVLRASLMNERLGTFSNEWINDVDRYGYPYYRQHRAPPHGFYEPGRVATWGPKTKPKAFIEHYDPSVGQVFLVPKRRKGGFPHRQPSRKPTGQYKRHIIQTAVEMVGVHKNGRLPKSGTSKADWYKWAKGYLKRQHIPIPAKTNANMGY